MIIQNYTQKYEENVVALWNECCTFDPIDVKKFRQQALFDENFDIDLAFIALVGDKLVGFIYGTKRKFPYFERGLESDRGWINVIFVDEEYRKQGVGQALYDEVEKKLIKLGVKSITVGAYSPNYFFWGLDPEHYPESISFFESNGYVAGDTHYSMGKNLHGYKIPESILRKRGELTKEGFKFINFDYSYALVLLRFLKEQFGGGWKRSALVSMKKGIAEDVIMIVLDKQDTICGFCMRAIDGNPMRFGPIGVDKKYQNEGIGSVLLAMACYEMAKKGIYRMYFVTTDENGKRYYERNELSVIRTFVEYRKAVK